jgi:hypothetical protein
MNDEQAQANLQLAPAWIDAVSWTGQAGCPGLSAGINAAHAVA